MSKKSIKKSEEKLVEEIREKADLILVVNNYTPLRRKKNKHIAYLFCPFCGKGNRFTADSEKQLYHCFGCGKGGDIFTFVMETRDMSFSEAIQYLGEEFHLVDIKEKEEEEKATHSNEELFCLLHDAKRVGYLLEFPQIKELYEKGEADHIRAYIERLGEDEAPAEQPDDNQSKILPTDIPKLKAAIQRGNQEEKQEDLKNAHHISR